MQLVAEPGCSGHRMGDTVGERMDGSGPYLYVPALSSPCSQPGTAAVSHQPPGFPSLVEVL